MLQGKPLFTAYNRKDERMNDAQHLANMIALLGPPPLEFLKRSRTYRTYWNEGGKWKWLFIMNGNG